MTGGNCLHVCVCLLQDGGGAGGDPDFDDDFMDAAPAPSSRHGAFGSTQQPAASMMGTPAASFRPTQSAAAFTAFTRPAAGTAAAGGSTAGGGASGPAVLVGGGLAGFCGRAEAGLGNPSAIWSPVLLLAPHNSSSSSGPSQPGFAVGGLGEGLSGLAGVEGAGLRVFAALSPAYGDTAQALLRLWRHMAGLAGWAPPDALLQAVVETATTAVCAGAPPSCGCCFLCCDSCAACRCTGLVVPHQQLVLSSAHCRAVPMLLS